MENVWKMNLPVVEGSSILYRFRKKEIKKEVKKKQKQLKIDLK